jgi:hypothetical protein
VSESLVEIVTLTLNESGQQIVTIWKNEPSKTKYYQVSGVNQKYQIVSPQMNDTNE